MKLIRVIVGNILLLINKLTLPKQVIRNNDQQKVIEAKLKKLSIYEFVMCPFCIKVRRHMHRQNLPIELKDAKESPYREELQNGGGKIQVPCLKIENEDGSIKWMYESSDIIQYLDQNIVTSA
jgi:glutaredoxin